MRQGLRLRHGGDRAGRAAGGAARPFAQAARARGAHRRGHGARPAREPARSRRAEPVGRDPAARVPAAQIRRPHPCQRDPEPGRPAGRRSHLRRGLRRTHRRRALRDAGLRARQGGGGRLRRPARRRGADPAQARHLHLRRRCARSLRAHDRAGHAGRGAAEAEPQGGVRDRATAASDRAARRRSRRSCAAPAASRTRRPKARGAG